MRIKHVPKGEYTPGHKFGPSQKVGIEVRHTPFFEQLEEAARTFFDLDIEGFMRELDEQGNRLIENPDEEQLKRYKDLIAGFITLVLKKTYDVKHLSGSKYARKQKVFTVIKRIDEKLEILTREIIRKQLDRFELISRIDEIKGLLIDLSV